MNIKQRVTSLRTAMKAKGLSAYIIPSSDPHQSEYVADYWKCREWLSGFTGSAGSVVVTLDKAGLWTDSRYYLQGAEQMEGTGIDLFKDGLPETPSMQDWLKSELKTGATVGVDGANFSISQIRNLQHSLGAANLDLSYDYDLFEDVWEGRTALPKEPVFEHEVKFTGQSRLERIDQIRSRMGDADGHLVTMLDDVAWTLNLRGSDVECNPVAITYLWVGKDSCFLFVDESKIDLALITELSKNKIHIQSYESIHEFLGELPKYTKVLIDPNTLNAKLYDTLTKQCEIIKGKSIATELKAIKNTTEISHIREAMCKDAVALIRLFMWLGKEVETRGVPEVEVAAKLAAFRKMGSNYYGESFPAIVGFKGNGAIVHYRAMPDTCASVTNEGMLLLDSGGQYHNGTTDITRTVIFGEASAQQKRHFTQVLKGHIALAVQEFPEGTRGIQLDTLTRQFLWNDQLNFGHGTGHGVGYFLNVHEGPQGIGPNTAARYLEPIKEGMFLSNEPGLYLTDEYGIRIENLVIAVESKKGNFGKFLKFDTLTLFPIEIDLMDVSILTPSEINWLNAYHQECWDKISPLLSDEKELAWLKGKCRGI
ncbi:MAG: aminopeptidase P family protein [Saprospiraceae bacterium]